MFATSPQMSCTARGLCGARVSPTAGNNRAQRHSSVQSRLRLQGQMEAVTTASRNEHQSSGMRGCAFWEAEQLSTY